MLRGDNTEPADHASLRTRGWIYLPLQWSVILNKQVSRSYVSSVYEGWNGFEDRGLTDVQVLSEGRHRLPTIQRALLYCSLVGYR